MIPAHLLGADPPEGDGRPFERRVLSSASSASGRLCFSDAFEGFEPDDAGDVQTFQVGTGGRLDFGVLARTQQPTAPWAASVEAIFVGRMEDWGPGPWQRLVSDDGNEVAVLCDGGALLAFPVEVIDAVIELQGDHERLADLVRTVMNDGPRTDSGALAVPAADGAFPCWGRMEDDGVLVALIVEIG